jgi:hypothetical protein
MMRKLIRVLLTVVLASGGVLALSQPALAVTTYLAHGCGNPSTVSGGIRAGVCGDLTKTSNRLSGQVQAFCQLATGDHHGVEEGVDVYRRTPSGSWVQLEHSRNAACGTLNPGFACWDGVSDVWNTDNTWLVDGSQPCLYYYAQGRATIVLPSGVSIPNIRVNSPEWGTPACSA